MSGVAAMSEPAAQDDGAAPVLPLATDRPEPLAQPDPTPPGELVEPGRALVLADFAPPALSPHERIVRLAYRLGVPATLLTSPIGKAPKTRLLATVEAPDLGERAAGVALRAGHFLVHGVKAPIGEIDFAPGGRLTPPFERVVHGFTWLDDLACCAPREHCLGTAERVLKAWLAANPAPGKGAAWQVENAGLRLLGWIVHAPLLLAGGDRKLRGKVLAQMEQTARLLDKKVTRAPDRLAEATGWAAIVAAGLLLPDGKPRRLYGEAGLLRALGELVAEDGGVLSRSPLAQLAAIDLLTRLNACYRAVRRDPPDALGAMHALLVPPLLTLVHGDGGLGSWQGAGAVSADRVAASIGASTIRTRPLRDVRQWGYQRVAAGPAVLQFDTAPPPLPRHARHGCASSLAFELSHGACRVIVNCGGAALAGGQVPLRIEQGLRATAAHSTLVLDDTNSTSILLNGKIGGGVSEVELDRRQLTLDGPGGAGTGSGGGATRIEASHDGYVARYGIAHRRILILRDDGSELLGEDLLVPAGKRARRGMIGYAIRFHVSPGVELGLADDGKGAGLALPDGSYWQFRAGEGEITIEESLWVDGDGRPQPIQQLVIQGMTARSGASFPWLLKKMG